MTLYVVSELQLKLRKEVYAVDYALDHCFMMACCAYASGHGEKTVGSGLIQSTSTGYADCLDTTAYREPLRRVCT